MNSWSKRENWDWAKEHASLFHEILPKHVCEAAMATCRFVILGKNANGNEYGKGFRTFLQTFGFLPTGLTNDVQLRHHWIELDAHDSANLILDCFGLSVQDVYSHYGEPVEGSKMTIDLYDIVATIIPEFALSVEAEVAVAVA